MNKDRKNQIEQAARKLHVQVWHERKELWPNGTPHPIDMLDLDRMAQLLGLRVEYYPYLGELPNRNSKVEHAGALDRQARRVAVSTKFSIAEQRFTLAHELGHYILHKALVIHRDRPMSLAKNRENSRRPLEEQEADYFAACLLMPEKLLRRAFKSNFGVDAPLNFDENVLFHLSNSSHDLLIKTPQGLRARSRLIASSERFDRRRFYSLSEQFHVSVDAMAIRLEELELVI